MVKKEALPTSMKKGESPFRSRHLTVPGLGEKLTFTQKILSGKVGHMMGMS